MQRKRIELNFEDKSTMIINYPEEIQENVYNLLKLCSANSMANNMLKSLISTQKYLIVDFTTKHLPSLGQWIPSLNMIEIKQELSLVNLLKTFIFECSNACNPKLNAVNGASFSSGDEYANYMEECEHDSFVLAYHTYKYGIDNANWPEPDDMFGYAESLSKAVWMAKSKAINDKYNGFKSHFEIYTSFYAQKMNAAHQSGTEDKSEFNLTSCQIIR